MKARELKNLGIPAGDLMRLALKAIKHATENGMTQDQIRGIIRKIIAQPEQFLEHGIFRPFAAGMATGRREQSRYCQRQEPAPWQSWGSGLEEGAIQQMRNACMLPIALRGALLPDAHQGYGLPIGGVLATSGAVIPYAVGMDIACRMKLTVLDLPLSSLERGVDSLKRAIHEETRFGVGASFHRRREHTVMDAGLWSSSPLVAQLKDKAWSQLGTSGSGNHFVEFGELWLQNDRLGLESGTYLALLSHSGSRGTGNEIATHFSRTAQRMHPELPKELQHLAWLELTSPEGHDYWNAMELMGLYASANHELIHKGIAANLGAHVLLDIENHHNFAWRERHDGQDVIVHRKGATPAGRGVVGIIPGSMATPGYVIMGKGSEQSLHSASHGAGRKMSRKAAKEKCSWKEAERFLKERGVTLISGGLDEVPMAYKDIESVMEAQKDLVQILARFMPRLVKMAPAGERPED